MKAVIFGASGYLGSHAAEQLTMAGHEVICVVRFSSDCSFLQTLPLKIIRSDFNDDAALAELIETGSTVINCTAETRMHLSDADRRLVEVDLTAKLFRAAMQAKAKRFIQLSTVMIYGFDRPVTAIDENFPVNPKYSYSLMAREREQLLFDLHQGSGTELVILRPSNTLGKRDSSALPALLASHEKGSFPVIGGGAWQYSCMDARDVGRAIEHLMHVEIGAPEIFLAKGYDITWLDVKAGLDEILDRPSKLMNVPKPMAFAIGWLMEKLYPFGKNPPLTRFSVEVVSSHTLFDDHKIRSTGFTPRYNLTETLCDALGKSPAS